MKENTGIIMRGFHAFFGVMNSIGAFAYLQLEMTTRSPILLFWVIFIGMMIGIFGFSQILSYSYYGLMLMIYRHRDFSIDLELVESWCEENDITCFYFTEFYHADMLLFTNEHRHGVGFRTTADFMAYKLAWL